MYQEEDSSSFTHDRIKYNLNSVLKTIANKPIGKINTKDLQWIFKYNQPTDKQRVEKADTTAPIIVSDYGDKKVVVDGLHRLQKAVNTGKPVLSARFITTKELKELKGPMFKKSNLDAALAGFIKKEQKSKLNDKDDTDIFGHGTKQTVKAPKELQYLLGPTELPKNRELSEDEESRISRNKAVNWKFMDPYAFPRSMEKKEPITLLQNPYYKSMVSTGKGILASMALPAAFMATMSKFKAHYKTSLGIALGSAGLGIGGQLFGYSNNVQTQKIRNKMIEEYIRSHPESSLNSYAKIEGEMTTKKKAPSKLIKKASFSKELYNEYGKLPLGLPDFYTAFAPIGQYKLLSHAWDSKAQLEDLRQRFEAKQKNKADATTFVRKVTKKELEEVSKDPEEDYFKGSAEDEMELLPHQQRVIQKLMRPDQPGLVVMHGVGRGKTLTSIAAARALGNKTEAIVPAALQDNFAKEIHKWTGHTQKEERISIHSQQNLARKGINPEAMKGRTLVVDESHRIRNSESKLYGQLKNAPAAKRILLSATPVYNHPSDISSQINLAYGKNILPERKPEFENEYIKKTVTYPSFLSRLRGMNPGVTESLKNTGKLKTILNKMVDYEPGDPKNFPEVTEEEVKVPMSERQQQLYQTAMGKLPWFIRAKIKAGLAPGKNELEKMLPFLTGIRQIGNTDYGFLKDKEQASYPKADAAFNYLKDNVKRDPNFKAVVYSNFLENGLSRYKALMDKEKIPYGEYTGEVNKSTRDQLIRDYNTNKIKNLLISSAGGEGLDLKGTRLVQLMEPHFNESKEKQIVGRASRYMSHEHLPPDQRKVLVQRYLATLRPGMMSKLTKNKEVGVDEYMRSLAQSKERLNNELIALMQNK